MNHLTVTIELRRFGRNTGSSGRLYAVTLTRREILEELSRLGIRTIKGLKKACREYETYWSEHLKQRSRG